MASQTRFSASTCVTGSHVSHDAAAIDRLAARANTLLAASENKRLPLGSTALTDVVLGTQECAVHTLAVLASLGQKGQRHGASAASCYKCGYPGHVRKTCPLTTAL